MSHEELRPGSHPGRPEPPPDTREVCYCGCAVAAYSMADTAAPAVPERLEKAA